MGIRLQKAKRFDRELVATPQAVPRTYAVVSGDTLWSIAERFYGDGALSHRIADANRVADPDLLHPGQILTIP